MMAYGGVGSRTPAASLVPVGALCVVVGLAQAGPAVAIFKDPEEREVTPCRFRGVSVRRPGNAPLEDPRP